LATVNGAILRLAAATGELQGKLELDQPLGGAPVPYANRLLVPGADGVLYATPGIP